MASSRKSKKSALVSQPDVPAHEERTVNVADIILESKHGANYQTHSEDQIQGMAESIKLVGLKNPVWIVEDEDGKLYLAGGELRVKAHTLLSKAESGVEYDTIRAKIFRRNAVGKSLSGTIAALRAIENDRDDVSFAARVRSVRQLRANHYSEKTIGTLWRLSEEYIKKIVKWDAKFPVGWEDKLTKHQAEYLASLADPSAAYAEFAATNKMPAKPAKADGASNKGRGAQKTALVSELSKTFPWAEKLPWDMLGISKTNFDAWQLWAESFARDVGLEVVDIADQN